MSLAEQVELYLSGRKYLYDLWKTLLFTVDSSVQNIV